MIYYAGVHEKGVHMSRSTYMNTRTSVPFLGDVNNRRFLTAVLAGILGGSGIGAASSLLRSYVAMRKEKKTDTDDDTIVITVPKAAEDAYTGMHDAKPGESKVTANGGRQFRVSGKYGGSVSRGKGEAGGEKTVEPVKKASSGNPGPNSVGTIVANAMGLTAGGLMAYEAVSRLFDAMNERRLKRKLDAARQAYISALSGASKRAEAVMSVIGPVERVLSKDAGSEKSAEVSDVVRYPVAAYILALLAGAGSTAYVTKKVLDTRFPEEKLKKDINRPTRIVFRTVDGEPSLVEGGKGEEKNASAETCAAITAMLPIYMDVVEGRPNRTLAAPYVKMARAAGTDPAGLMKLAASDMAAAYKVVLSDPEAVVAVLRETNFGLNFDGKKALKTLKKERPDTYRRAIDAGIDAYFAGKPGDGLVRKAWNAIGRMSTKMFAGLGGRDILANSMFKASSIDAEDILASDMVRKALSGDSREDSAVEYPDEERLMADMRRKLRRRRIVEIEAKDPGAAAFLKKNRRRLSKVLTRLNARGVL